MSRATKVWAFAVLAAMAVVTCFSAFCWAQSAPDEKVVAKATAKAREVTRNLLGARCEDPEARAIFSQEPLVRDDDGRLTLFWLGAAIFIVEKDCRLVSAGLPRLQGSRDSWVGPVTAGRLAVACYQELSGLADCEASFRFEGLRQWGTNDFEVTPVFEGARCIGESAGSVTIDAATGLPLSVKLGKEPRFWVEPGAPITKQRAVEAFLRDMRRIKELPKGRIAGVQYAWQVPSFYLYKEEMSPRMRAAGRAGQSALLYHVWVRDVPVPGLDARELRIDGYVDAKTGKTIAAMVIDVTGSPAWAVQPPDPVMPVWPGAGAEISVLGAPEAIAGAAIEPCEAGKAPGDGVLVTITSGRDAWNVRFDRKSGLVWMDAGGKRVYGKPNAPLLKALEKVKPTKLTPFGGKKLAKAG